MRSNVIKQCCFVLFQLQNFNFFKDYSNYVIAQCNFQNVNLLKVRSSKHRAPPDINFVVTLFGFDKSRQCPCREQKYSFAKNLVAAERFLNLAVEEARASRFEEPLANARQLGQTRYDLSSNCLLSLPLTPSEFFLRSFPLACAFTLQTHSPLDSRASRPSTFESRAS